MELIKIIKYLEKKFPLKLASKWDKPGLQNINPQKSIDPSQNIEKILICLDLTWKVLEQAINQNIGLIITRHPFLFEELTFEKKNPIKKLMIQKLIENKILVYSIHTNYDASPNQKLSFLLAEKLKVKKTMRIGSDKQGYQVKLKSNLKLIELKNLLENLFEVNQSLTNLNWKDDLLINEFYLVTGAGGQTLITEQLQNCVFITGELKWNDWIYVNDNNIHSLALGHYMENYFVNHVQEMLINVFPELFIITFNIQNQYN